MEHKIFKGLETAITFTDFEELDEFVLRLGAERIKKPVTALSQTFRSLLSTLVASQFFWAIYVAIATGVLAIRAKPIATLLEKGVSGVEHAGQYLQPLIPAFMFAVGVYVQALPSQLNGQIGSKQPPLAFRRSRFSG